MGFLYRIPAIWRGRAGEGNSEKERGLFERSEFRSSRIPLSGAGDPKGHVRAKMVLAPLAETKGARRAGATPRYYKLFGKKSFGGKSIAKWKEKDSHFFQFYFEGHPLGFLRLQPQLFNHRFQRLNRTIVTYSIGRHQPMRIL